MKQNSFLEASIAFASVSENSYYYAMARAKTKQAKRQAAQKFARKGTTLLKAGDFEAALEQAEKALALDPDNEEARNIQERAQNRNFEASSGGQGTGGGQQSAPRRNGAASSAPSQDSSSGSSGSSASGSAARSAARNQEEQPQPVQELDARGLFEEGMNYFRMGNFTKAIESFRNSTKKDPNYAPSYKAMGSAYASIQKPDKAMLAYQKFLKLAPNDPQAEQIRRFVEDYRSSMENQ